MVELISLGVKLIFWVRILGFEIFARILGFCSRPQREYEMPVLVMSCKLQASCLLIKEAIAIIGIHIFIRLFLN